MITIITKSTCPFCSASKQLLDALGKQYNEIEISNNPELYRQYKDISGMRTVPQIYLWEVSKENLIGWYDDMMSKYSNKEIFTD